MNLNRVRHRLLALERLARKRQPKDPYADMTLEEVEARLRELEEKEQWLSPDEKREMRARMREFDEREQFMIKPEQEEEQVP